MRTLIALTATALLFSACASTPKKAADSQPAKSETVNQDALADMLGLMMTGQGRDEETFKAQLKSAKQHALGTKNNPVRVWHPQGERDYLSRLNCPDGNTPDYERDGSFGGGPYGTILDRYTVECEGQADVKVYMDMYHKTHKEMSAIEGFTIDK